MTSTRDADGLKAAGLAREDSIWISDRAHVVLPYHQLLDAAREDASSGKKIGTTLRVPWGFALAVEALPSS